MNKFKKIINTLKQKHNKSGIRSCFEEIFLILYKNKLLRKYIRKTYSIKEPKNIIFIVGCYNSGSTLLKSILQQHNSLVALPCEGDLLTEELDDLEVGGHHRGLYANLKKLPKLLEYKICKEKLLHDFAPYIENNKILIEKSISNSLRLKVLLDLFPNAKVIVIHRNKEQIVNGIKKRSTQPSGEPYSTDFLLKQYQFIYNQIIGNDNGEFIYVDYSEIIHCPVITIKRLFNSINIVNPDLKFENKTLSIGTNKIKIVEKQISKLEKINSREKIIQKLEEEN
jgi:hypothetical protein